MTEFFARVELHGNIADYDQLHEIMKGAGWSRTFHDDETYKLPSAMYSKATSTKSAVELANDIIAKLDAMEVSEKPAWVLVVKAADYAWRLDPA